MIKQGNLFEGQRLQMDQSIDLTIQSLLTYGPQHKHWAIAWSGGKDSTTLLTLVVWLIESGKVPRPETLTVCYADTRMELLPLSAAALDIQDELRERGIEVRVAMAPMDKRFFVYMLGRGVPPPNNNTFRWCTRQIKIEPMAAELRRLFGDRGEKILMLTGVRQGESAMRDGRIAMSCGKDGAECGQGWYQEMTGRREGAVSERIPCRMCPTCPFRPGNEREGWEPGARTDLIAGLERLDWFMECHDEPEAACAGWVGTMGRESLAVRLAVLRGRLRPVEPMPGQAEGFAEFDERARGAKGWT